MPVFGQQEAGESVADVEEPGNGLIFGGKDLLSFENLEGLIIPNSTKEVVKLCSAPIRKPFL